MTQKMFKARTLKSDIIFMFLLAVGYYKIGFYKILHFVEIVLMGVAILCFGPAIYVAELGVTDLTVNNPKCDKVLISSGTPRSIVMTSAAYQTGTLSVFDYPCE